MTKETNNKHGFIWYLRYILGGGFLFKQSFEKHALFGIFLLLMVILFISNTFIAQNTLRKKEKAEKELRGARIKAIEMRSKLMTITRPSVLYDQVQSLDLEEPSEPPKKIIVERTAED